MEGTERRENYLKRVVDHILEGFLIIGFDWRCLYLNDVAAKHIGREQSDLLDRRITLAVPGIERTDLFRMLKKGMETREVVKAVNELVYPDGSTVWLELLIQPMPEGISVVTFDITEQKRAQEALRESEERFRSIFDNSPLGLGICSLDGQMVRANRSYCEMLGYSEDEVPGKRFYDYTHPDDREMNRQLVTRLRDGEIESAHIEKRYIRKDESIIWTSVHVNVIRDASGRPLLLAGQVLDITGRKKRMEKIVHLNSVLRGMRDVNQLIAEEKDSYRLIQEICRLLVETRGCQGALIVLTNDAALPRIYAEAGIGEAFQLLVDDLRRGILPPCCNDSLFDEGVHVVANRSTFCSPCKLSSAEYVPGDTLCIRLRYQGKAQGYMAITASRELIWDDEQRQLFAEMAGDIAFALHNIEREQEARRAEEVRLRAETQLIQAQKMEALGTLAGGIAHDFNNILGVILGFTELAHSQVPKGSPIRGELEEVLKATQRARELVQQILAFSRQKEQEYKPLQIGLIVKEALRMLRASLPSTIEIRSNVKTKAVVLADPTQIHQVLMNLCTNASHAMREEGGVLDVSLTDVDLTPEAIQPHSSLRPGPHVRLTVKDTGHGIDPEILDRIFDPFFTTKEQGVGTGLGLAVVHGIVKSHRGTIEVESLLGRGTSFQVLLPARSSVRAVEATEHSPPPRGRERILFVDDEPSLARVGKEMLERLGYEVHCRTSSVEALEAFRHQSKERPFDLVITDMTMPHLTGEDLARELRRLQPNIRLLLCTGFSEKISVEQAEDLGIQGFLMKPVVMRDLAGMVRKVLDQKT